MTWVRRFLAVTLMVQCAGALGTAIKKGTALHTTLFLNLDFPDLATRWVDQGLAVGGILAAAICLARPSRALAMYLIAYAVALAGCGWIQGASYFAGMTIPAWAARMAAPVALLLAMWEHPKARDALMWVVRVGVAVTFLAHGIEAVRHQPSFQNLIMATEHRWIGVGIPQAAMERALDVIGVVDLVVAALLLSGRRWKIVAGYMSMWGFVTASSRLTAWGWSGLDATALRAAHGALPLLLVWMWRQDETSDTGVGGGSDGDDERDGVGDAPAPAPGHHDRGPGEGGDDLVDDR